MNKYKVYDLQKEKRIETLLEKIDKTNHLDELYKMNNVVFEEYQFYSFDKALPESLINNYFFAYEEGYSGLAYTTAVKRNQLNYTKLYSAYKDALYSRIKPNTEEALRLKEKEYRDSRNLGMSYLVNSQKLENVEMGSRGFSLVTFERSLLYELNSESEKQKVYLTLSAILDIKASVKDNASMGTLAKILFMEGDIDNSHRAHSSKFVPSGFVSIGSSNWSEFPNVAYKTPEGKIVVVVLNNSDVQNALNINVSDEPITVTLPAELVATFVW